MIWHDVIVQRHLSDQEMARGLAAGFRISRHEVLVHRDADDFPEHGVAMVVCIAIERAEGFRCVMSLYTYFDTAREDDPVIVIKEFARVAETECLVSDDSPNPYTMIHILPSGDVFSVKLDAIRLDDTGEYHIIDIASMGMPQDP